MSGINASRPLLATSTLAIAAPGNGVPSAAVGGQIGTFIFGTFTTNSAVGVNENGALYIESGVGTGVYTKVHDIFEVLGNNAHDYPFMIFVPTGRRWKWTDDQGNPPNNGPISISKIEV